MNSCYGFLRTFFILCLEFVLVSGNVSCASVCVLSPPVTELPRGYLRHSVIELVSCTNSSYCRPEDFEVGKQCCFS